MKKWRSATRDTKGKTEDSEKLKNKDQRVRKQQPNKEREEFFYFIFYLYFESFIDGAWNWAGKRNRNIAPWFWRYLLSKAPRRVEY